MTIKVLCACGQKFAFEIEPVDGRMPTPVQCPACGADGTETANQAIAAQIAAASPSLPPAPPSAGDGVKLPTPAEARTRVRVSGAAPAVPAPSETAPAEAPAFETCHRHTLSPLAAHCAVCQKGICLECMEQFGYLCSVWCKEQAAKKKIPVPGYAHQKSNLAAAEDRKGNRILAGLGIAAVIVIALSVWYNFFLSKPKVAFALESGTPFIFSQWVGADRIVALTTEKLTLHEIGSSAPLWEAAFKPDEKPVRRSSLLLNEEQADEQIFFTSGLNATVAGGDIWVFFPTRAVRFDAASGQREQEIALPPPVDTTYVTGAAFLAIGERTPMLKVVSRIDFASGKLQSTVVTQSLSRPYAPAARTISTAYAAGSDLDDAAPNLLESGRELFLSESSVVHLQSRLLELRITQVQAMSDREGPAILDSSNVRASQGWEAAEQFLNDSKRERTGGMRQENESRYAVTLKRLVGPGRSWSGEVIGAPTFFPLRTIDLLVAGKTVYAFDKTGQKLWESKLHYGIAPRFFAETEQAPAFEHSGKLFFFDQGTLTAMDLRSGEVKWRYQTVGVSQVCADSQGHIYVSTTTAGPDKIQYSEDISLSDKIHPVILKMDPAKGTVIWQSPRLGERAFVSGKYLYAARGQISRMDMFSAATGEDDEAVPIHHRVHRLDPDNGQEEWEYYRPQAPRAIEPKGNRILLQYPNEIQVLKFFSL